MVRRKNQRDLSIKESGATTLRIIGGKLRGRKLKYAGDSRVRPMKDRVRESLFNLLGPSIKGTFAIDLFGGTGALALEAISRGATGAIIVERHLPTAKIIRENINTLGLQKTVQQVSMSAFRWYRQRPELPETPWVVFVSPPYRFFHEHCGEMLELVSEFLIAAPGGSMIAVEATNDFDFDRLPSSVLWDVRSYPPAVVGVFRITDKVRETAQVGSD